MSDDNIWMPLYIGDYLADTQLLTTEQHGAYLLLIIAYWKNGGPLPADDEILMSVCKMTPAKWKKAKPSILKMFKSQGDELVHKRIDKELAEAKKRRKDAKEKARKAANARWSADAPSIPPSNAPSNAPSIPPGTSSGSAPRYASHNHSHSKPLSQADQSTPNFTTGTGGVV